MPYLLYRLHIFDIKEAGKYHDGFKSGNIAFKVRKTEDKDFCNKISEVNSKVKKMGLALNKNNATSTKRPM